MESSLVKFSAEGDLDLVQKHLRVMTANCLDSTNHLAAIQTLRVEKNKALAAAVANKHKAVISFLSFHVKYSESAHIMS